jgi:flagellar biosynthesis/type III secretory pathway protein FliH
VRFRAMCDLTSMQNASHRKGLEEGMEIGLAKGRDEGLTQAREEILKLFEQGLSIEEIKKQMT